MELDEVSCEWVSPKCGGSFKYDCGTDKHLQRFWKHRKRVGSDDEETQKLTKKDNLNLGKFEGCSEEMQNYARWARLELFSKLERTGSDPDKYKNNLTLDGNKKRKTLNEMLSWSILLAHLQILWNDLLVPSFRRHQFSRDHTRRITESNRTIVQNEVTRLQEIRIALRKLCSSTKIRESKLEKLHWLSLNHDDFTIKHLRQLINTAVEAFSDQTAILVVNLHFLEKYLSNRSPWGTVGLYCSKIQEQVVQLIKDPVIPDVIKFRIAGNPLLRNTFTPPSPLVKEAEDLLRKQNRIAAESSNRTACVMAAASYLQPVVNCQRIVRKFLCKRREERNNPSVSRPHVKLASLHALGGYSLEDSKSSELFENYPFSACNKIINSQWHFKNQILKAELLAKQRRMRLLRAPHQFYKSLSGRISKGKAYQKLKNRFLFATMLQTITQKRSIQMEDPSEETLIPKSIIAEKRTPGYSVCSFTDDERFSELNRKSSIQMGYFERPAKPTQLQKRLQLAANNLRACSSGTPISIETELISDYILRHRAKCGFLGNSLHESSSYSIGLHSIKYPDHVSENISEVCMLPIPFSKLQNPRVIIIVSCVSLVAIQTVQSEVRRRQSRFSIATVERLRKSRGKSLFGEDFSRIAEEYNRKDSRELSESVHRDSVESVGFAASCYFPNFSEGKYGKRHIALSYLLSCGMLDSFPSFTNRIRKLKLFFKRRTDNLNSIIDTFNPGGNKFTWQDINLMRKSASLPISKIRSIHRALTHKRMSVGCKLNMIAERSTATPSDLAEIIKNEVESEIDSEDQNRSFGEFSSRKERWSECSFSPRNVLVDHRMSSICEYLGSHSSLAAVLKRTRQRARWSGLRSFSGTSFKVRSKYRSRVEFSQTVPYCSLNYYLFHLKHVVRPTEAVLAQHDFATKLQVFWKGVLARRKLQQLREARRELERQLQSEKEIIERDCYATLIQRWWRRTMAELDLKYLRTTAAVMLQRWWRMSQNQRTFNSCQWEANSDEIPAVISRAARRLSVLPRVPGRTDTRLFWSYVQPNIEKYNGLTNLLIAERYNNFLLTTQRPHLSLLIAIPNNVSSSLAQLLAAS